MYDDHLIASAERFADDPVADEPCAAEDKQSHALITACRGARKGTILP
jgi:hypothetical protein